MMTVANLPIFAYWSWCQLVEWVLRLRLRPNLRTCWWVVSFLGLSCKKWRCLNNYWPRRWRLAPKLRWVSGRRGDQEELYFLIENFEPMKKKKRAGNQKIGSIIQSILYTTYMCIGMSHTYIYIYILNDILIILPWLVIVLITYIE